MKVNGNALRFDGNTLEIFYAENGLNTAEIRNFQFGPIQYGLYQRDNIPFLLIEVAGLKFDFVINGYDLIPFAKRVRLRKYSGRASFTIVLPGSNREVAGRLFLFDPHFTDHMKSCLLQQWRFLSFRSSSQEDAEEFMEFLVTKNV